MGVTYIIIPAAEVHRHPFAVECFGDFDMALPARSKTNRNPTPSEVRQVLDELQDHNVEYFVTSQNWQANVESQKGFGPFRANTLINAVDFIGDESIPHLFYFDKGDLKLNVLIVERLAKKCGPLYIFPDTGAQPLLVTSGIDPVDAENIWQIG